MTDPRSDSRSEVRSEMVATVLEVMTSEGARVAVGDVLLLLESMKMEIPVVTETAGTVSAVAAHAGMVVQADDLLAVIDTGPAGPVVVDAGRG